MTTSLAVVGLQKIITFGHTHPDKTDQHLWSTEEDLYNILPPGPDSTPIGALEILRRGIVTTVGLRLRLVEATPKPFYYQGVLISWALAGKIVTPGQAVGQRQWLPVLIKCIDGNVEGFTQGIARSKTLLPPGLCEEVRKYDKLLKKVYG